MTNKSTRQGSRSLSSAVIDGALAAATVGTSNRCPGIRPQTAGWRRPGNSPDTAYISQKSPTWCCRPRSVCWATTHRPTQPSARFDTTLFFYGHCPAEVVTIDVGRLVARSTHASAAENVVFLLGDKPTRATTKVPSESALSALPAKMVRNSALNRFCRPTIRQEKTLENL